METGKQLRLFKTDRNCSPSVQWLAGRGVGRPIARSQQLAIRGEAAAAAAAAASSSSRAGQFGCQNWLSCPGCELVQRGRLLSVSRSPHASWCAEGESGLAWPAYLRRSALGGSPSPCPNRTRTESAIEDVAVGGLLLLWSLLSRGYSRACMERGGFGNEVAPLAN